MMKLNNILIVEDEKPNADRIKRLVTKLRPQSKIVSVEDSVIGSVNWLKINPMPDLILMDIRLSDGLSFEIFNQLEITCPVIFTTAYDEYAVKAFKYNSIDYLLKPIEEEDLDMALKRYENFIDSVPYVNSAIAGLLNYMQPKDYRKRFLIPHKDGYKTLLVEDVMYFFTELGINYAVLFNGNTEVVPQNLEELEGQLDPKLFFRANRQFIIHVNSVKHIHNDFNGKVSLELKLSTTSKIIVSREKAPSLKTWLDF